MPILARACLACLLAVATAAGAAPVVDDAAHTVTDVRDARYCELIPIRREGLHLVATVYNTLGLNDCPAAIWETITEADMKRRFDALTVLLNGPRYFLMDAISGTGATAAGATIEAGGLKLTQRATLDLSLLDLVRRGPYRETTVDRETRYLFKAGRPVFVLTAADGTRYAMQAYAQIVDRTLTYADLPGLGARLKPPTGWRYSVLTPEADLVLGAKGKATVIQDELQNTYQKMD
jgi:hypothetical protein